MPRTSGDRHRDPYVPMDEECPTCGEPLEANSRAYAAFGPVERKVSVRYPDPDCRYRDDRPAEDAGF